MLVESLKKGITFLTGGDCISLTGPDSCLPAWGLDALAEHGGEPFLSSSVSITSFLDKLLFLQRDCLKCQNNVNNVNNFKNVNNVKNVNKFKEVNNAKCQQGSLLLLPCLF